MESLIIGQDYKDRGYTLKDIATEISGAPPLDGSYRKSDAMPFSLEDYLARKKHEQAKRHAAGSSQK
jgi:hypothetical protein